MKLFFSRRGRWAGTLAALALLAASAAVGPRIVRAFTIIPNIIFFDPVSVPMNHSLHVHFFNRFGADNMDVRFSAVGVFPGAVPVIFGPFTVAPNEGREHVFSFASFGAPGSRVPVVASILVTDSNGLPPRLPADWSGTVATSAEVLNDKTGYQLAILGSRHIVQDGTGSPRFCLSCN